MAVIRQERGHYMNMKTLILIGGALTAAVWYLISARITAMRSAPPPAHLAMVIDNSTSQSLQCEALPAIALDALSDMPLGKHSRFSVFTLGSPASSYEPVMALDTAAPRKGGSMYGGSFKDELKRACGGFSQVDASSIFRAVQVALDHLRGEGCGASLPSCKLLVESDGEETVARSFYKSGTGKGALPNDGITVLWCGYAATEGGGGPRGEQSDALISKWRRAFANPAGVTFKPFCQAAAGAQAAAR